MFCNLCLVGFL